MGLFLEILKFIIYSLVIVYISKNILVKLIRKLAEVLGISPKTVGNIAGFATSVPELLTVFFSSLQGLFSTSIYNIISSNVINFIQYICSIVINKNGYILRNNALRIELLMILLTIIIPIFMATSNSNISIFTIPIFIIAFLVFYRIKENVYKMHHINVISDEEIRKIQDEEKWVKAKRKVMVRATLELLGVGILLFIIGNLLGSTLENLSNAFNINQMIIGIILGFVTSIPELITFIEAQKHHGKKKDDKQGVIEATSNLFTSNVLNLFITLSVGILTFWIVSLS